jgi:hypothetical protein
VIESALLIISISLAFVGIVSVMAFASVYRQGDDRPPWRDE